LLLTERDKSVYPKQDADVHSLKSVLKDVASCFVYAAVIALATLIGTLLFEREMSQFLLFLAYALLVEGGLALATGGIVAFFSPTFGKVREAVFHQEPWNAKRQKEAEGTARSWIFTGLILFALGLLISAL